MRNWYFVLQFFLRQLALTLAHSVGSWLSEAVALLRLYMLTFSLPSIMILQAISRSDVFDVPKNAQPDISILAGSPHAYVNVRRGSLVPFHPFRKTCRPVTIFGARSCAQQAARPSLHSSLCAHQSTPRYVNLSATPHRRVITFSIDITTRQNKDANDTLVRGADNPGYLNPIGPRLARLSPKRLASFCVLHSGQHRGRLCSAARLLLGSFNQKLLFERETMLDKTTSTASTSRGLPHLPFEMSSHVSDLP